MESRIFIREAQVLIKDIDDHELLKITRTPEEISASAGELQIRVNQLFAALQNPSLMAADALRARAVSAGLSVSNKVSNEIDRGQTFWENNWV